VAAMPLPKETKDKHQTPNQEQCCLLVVLEEPNLNQTLQIQTRVMRRATPLLAPPEPNVYIIIETFGFGEKMRMTVFFFTSNR
jgi:hypothetical protein